MELLFIDACPRGQALSRTLKLCEGFLSAFRGQFSDAFPGEEMSVTRLSLAEEALSPLTGEAAALRSELNRSGRQEGSMFRYARQFAAADLILVGAPCWDLSFPAILKVYIENVSCDRITFHYTEEGREEGLCRFRQFAYITTAGGFFGDLDFGTDYMRGMAGFFGQGDFFSVKAEGLDISPEFERQGMERGMSDVTVLAAVMVEKLAEE